MVRAYCAKLLGIDIANIRAIPAEIGGGFGGKTLVYLEPVALALSKKAGRPVKIVMSREEVFRATGPAAGGVYRGQARRQEGRHGSSRPNSCVKYQAGAFPGSPVGPACMCGFAMYDIPNVNIVGYDVVSQPAEGRRLSRARRAELDLRRPRAASTSWRASSNIDPLELREINAAKDGTKAAHGPTWANIGYQQTLEAAKAHAHLKTPLGPNQGRGIASGFWFNIGGESAAAVPHQRGRHAPASSRATPISAARAPRWR